MHWDFDAIGTHWRITAPQAIQQKLRTEILDRIEVFDRSYSRFRSDGLIAAIRDKAGKYTLPADAEPLLQLYKRLYEMTDGHVSPLVGRALEQLGYDAEYSLTPGQVDTIPTWDEALSYEPPELEVKQAGLVLDFGAAGKGYLVDIVAELLRKDGHEEFVVNAGGDVFVHGRSQRIELEDPLDPTRSLGYVELRSGHAICASAANRRRWRDVHHIINPEDGQSDDSLTASWVITDSCMLADGLATAVWFAEPQNLSEEFEFDYLLIAGDSMRHSEGFNATLYTKDKHV